MQEGIKQFTQYVGSKYWAAEILTSSTYLIEKD